MRTGKEGSKELGPEGHQGQKGADGGPSHRLPQKDASSEVGIPAAGVQDEWLDEPADNQPGGQQGRQRRCLQGHERQEGRASQGNIET